MAIPYNPTGNTVGLWHLDGNSNDSTANGGNGTDTSISYSSVNGYFNQGAGLNGSTSKISINNNAILTPANAITIGFWMKPSGAPETTDRIIHKENALTPRLFCYKSL